MGQQNKLFNSVIQESPKSNVFDLTHDFKFSANMGDLVPVMCIDAIPGDKYNISAESMIRFAPLIAPVMHRYDVSIHYFFCPNRLVWPNWEKYITNTKSGTPAVLPAAPYITINEGVWGPLMDYMGIPPDTQSSGLSFDINALPFACFQKIWNDYYRDQNLIEDLFSTSVGPNITLIDGDNSANLGPLTDMRKRAWEHDYFTSALPFAQKGEAVAIPLGEPVLKPDWQAVPTDPTENPTFKDAAGAFPSITTYQYGVVGGEPSIVGTGATSTPVAYDPNGSLEVQPTTINDLRAAFKLQTWLEKNARGGTRYIELIRAHFNVKSSDARLQRPEYITGTNTPVMISEVLNTAGNNDLSLPQGNMAGHGISVGGGKRGSFRCEEHGYIFGIMSVRPKTAYMQGIPKHFLKITDPTEYFWPDFQHLGEQPILKSELYLWDNSASDTFGYTPRYAEYRFMLNRVAGDFRTTLDFWHHARLLDDTVELNQEFIECNPDTRVFAVEDPGTDKLYCVVLNKVTAVRPIAKYGTPTF